MCLLLKYCSNVKECFVSVIGVNVLETLDTVFRKGKEKKFNIENFTVFLFCLNSCLV